MSIAQHDPLPADQLAGGVHRITFEQAALLDPDLEPGDLVNGEWLPVSRNTWRHGEIVGNAYASLRQYVRANSGWSISVGDPGTKLAHNPDRLRGPDVGVTREDRRPVGRGAAGWLEGAPELAVEVVGDDQSASELLIKAVEYLTAGGQMVWVIDPGPQLVTVATAPDRFRVLRAGDELDGGEVLPGFRCPVAELFE